MGDALVFLRHVLNALTIALGALSRWPLRAALTAFGILIGVAAVTTTVALGEGTRRKISAQVDKLGSNSLTVQAQSRGQSGAVQEDSLALLTEADGDAILEAAPSVEHVAPMLVSREQLVFATRNIDAEIVGTTRDFFAVRAWATQAGALWDESAEKTGAKVCLIGQSLKEELFEGIDPVGRVMRIDRHPFRVIGVLEAKGQDTFGRDEDARVLIPIKAARSKLRPARFGLVDTLLINARTPELSDAAKGEATRILRQRHGLAEGVESDFRIRSQSEFRAVQGRVLGVLEVLLTSVALVSLVVGGVGIMNIMLVSVAERTREIGIRMAVGARERDIMVQFLVEALVLSLIGGGLGTAAAAVAIEGLSSVLELPMKLSPSALSVALAVSMGIGVVFGFLPARSAAALDPIEALRAE
jgi:putative ABC transport system permease protein